MKISEFKKAGHWPTLFSAFLYFDFSFMVWVMLGALGVFLAADLQLEPGQKALLVALPLLSGAAFRVVLGSLVDSKGPRKAALMGLCLTALPLLMGWFAPHTYAAFLVVGVLLGIAGASFAAALPLAGRWYPPQFQGLALGIAGAGNSGTVLAAFFAPRAAQWLGWQNVFGLLLLPWAAVLVVFLLMSKEPPAPKAQLGEKKAELAAMLRESTTWKFCGRYALTFGGFVGLASFLPIFLHDQYGMDKMKAANLTALCVMGGSFLRPLGGSLADRFGGEKVLMMVFSAIASLSLAAALLPSLLVAGVVLVALLSCLGLGNGALFQLVPQTFGQVRLGRITGLMGAAGGLGGFCLPMLLGNLKGSTGSFGWGFGVWAGLAALATLASALRLLRQPSAAGLGSMAGGEEA
ncbi:MAG: MFS transporter [candidate division FCPU426 bacterium]